MTTTNPHSETIEWLQNEIQHSLHFTTYPQDRFKDEEEIPTIKVLITASLFHEKRVVKLRQTLEVLRQ